MRGIRLAAPRWWPNWFGFGLLRLATLLPLGLQRALGRGAGRLLYRLIPSRRRITRINLQLCLPELDERARERLVRRHFEQLGESVFESACAWWRAPAFLDRLGEIHGGEHLQAALARGKGVLLLQGHFLATDSAGQILGLHWPITTTYAEPKNPVVRHLIERVRGRRAHRQIHHTEVRAILRALAANEIIWHGPDQAVRRNVGVAAQFFGRPALTNPATARLAKISGAAVVPYHPHKRDDGHFELRIEPALADFPGTDLTAATQRVNDTIERQIRIAPEQYLWSHRRFRPPRKGDPSPYDPSPYD